MDYTAMSYYIILGCHTVLIPRHFEIQLFGQGVEVVLEDVSRE